MLQSHTEELKAWVQHPVYRAPAPSSLFSLQAVTSKCIRLEPTAQATNAAKDDCSMEASGYPVNPPEWEESPQLLQVCCLALSS
jgi:hypothetical protein